MKTWLKVTVNLRVAERNLSGRASSEQGIRTHQTIATYQWTISISSLTQ